MKNKFPFGKPRQEENPRQKETKRDFMAKVPEAQLRQKTRPSKIFLAIGVILIIALCVIVLYALGQPIPIQ